MLIKIKESLRRHLINLPGWRTSRKIVVIESDDWGSIRMPSKEAYQTLLKAGIRVDQCPYNRYDSLASEADLSALFEVLTSFSNKNGQHPVITANAIMANPDFDKIKDAHFQSYFYEPFTKSLQHYPNHTRSWDLWKEGMQTGIFYPQLHGREHLNVNRWLKILQSGSTETHLAFQNRLFGLSTNITQEKRRSYMAALDYDSQEDIPFIKQSLQEGASLFKSIFGYTSASFIGPSYCWDRYAEQALQAANITVLQGSRVQKLPIGAGDGRISHHIGQKNSLGQIYLVRNCIFEPSITGTGQAVEKCLSSIHTAFLWKKPAVITSHRLNYIGSLDSKNRDTNLTLLSNLLTSILRRWPDVEFWHSAQLGEYIHKSYSAA